MNAMSRRREWDGTILLVADEPSSAPLEGDFDRRIDQPVADTINALKTALEASAKRVISISDLGELTDRAGRHSQSLVFPYWFGQNSRSRHGLVPAICEANAMMYVGADTFVKVVCNDKELSKTICRQAGLETPASGIVRNLSELRFVRHLRLPIIVKPNYEGTSLGITSRNRCKTWLEAESVSQELLSSLEQPLVIEEFITGREFSVCLMRTGIGLEAKVGSWVINGKPDFLDDKVFSSDMKRSNLFTMAFEEADDILGDAILGRMKDCFHRLGKAEILRIDGRLVPGGCKIIELTPDIYFGPDGEFASLYRPVFGNYHEFVSALIRNCIEGYGAKFPM